ncbi:MAG: hypothetical protein QOD26_426 [Betaproteobacteria bacterium]|jgi:hypothetical protein|nr:hypothetical protein [Betaproteobacteria bacterium]
MQFQKKSLAVAVTLALGAPLALAAPTVAWKTPTAGATMYGAYSNSSLCEATASGANRVKFYVDTQEVATDSSSPYQCAFDTRNFKAGAHTLKVTAIASDGTTASATRSVTFGTSSTGTTTTSNAAPSVSMTSPANGQTVSGTITYAATAADDKAVSRVVFTRDSGMTLATDTTAPYSGTLDTKTLPNGTHTIRAQAFDAEGLSSTSQISINVQNSTTTTANAAPSVSLTAPTSGQTVSGTLALSAIAADDHGVSKVVFMVDSTTLATDTTSPYSASLNTTTLANGTHTVKAQAFDASGLSTTSQVSINVQNTATTPPPSGSTATPAPTSGTLGLWFKSPQMGNTVSGTLSGTKCYVLGSGMANVAFKIDSTALNTDTSMSDGMQCVLDTTKFSNGTHTLTATATSSTGATRSDVISINIQNSGSTTPPVVIPPVVTPPVVTPPVGGVGTTPPPPPPSTGAMPTDSSNVRGVATFHSIGMYWTSPGASSSGCKMQFRKQGESAWRDAMDMWFDGRNSECRGSIVQLQPGTQYEVQMGLPGQSFKKGATVATWSESFPIAQTITLPASSSSTLNITSGGTASGYVLYQAASGGSTIDVANGKANNVIISAPYVIVRGLTLKGAQQDAVLITGAAHDVVIENNDISGWGRLNYTNSGGWQVGVDMDSGIRCKSASNFERGIVQRNKIHDPRYGANSWDWGHPAGPQGITYSYCGGNQVIRYNEIYSTTGQQHYYNDAIGGEDNFTATGFPNYDSDIYGNKLSEAWDDGIEAEGGNKNVRVYGNYTNNTNTGVASTVAHWGPFYVFRNVHNRSRAMSLKALDSDDRNNAYKSGEKGGFGGGRRYFLHNTLLQATQSGASNGLGMGGGISGNTGEPLTNSIARNNILHVWKSGSYSIYTAGGTTDDADYDLRNGSVNVSGGETHGFVGTPIYLSGHGWQSEAGGSYQLSPTSLGFGKAQRLANFNDDYAAPDVGAHQSGIGSMSFGVNASGSFWVSGTPVGGASTSVTGGTSGTSTSTSTPTSTPTTPVIGPVAIPQ